MAHVPSFNSVASLEAIPTVGLLSGMFLFGTVDGAFVIVQLKAGDEETGFGFVRPADHSITGLVWVQLS